MTKPSSKLDNPERNGTRRIATHVAVAALCAVIGFGAVYWTGKATANPPSLVGLKTAASPKAPITQPADPKLAENRAATAPAVTKTAAPAALPTGPGRNALSVGEMAMFVFRKPEPLPPISFTGPDGAPVTPETLKGKVTLVNLWATWCAPCRKEMPDLNALQKELGGDDFQVVAVSLDRGADKAPKAFLKEIGADALPFYHDATARLGTKLKIIGLPATLLLDRDANVVGRLVGPAKWAGEDAKRLIKAAIDAGGAS